MNAKKPLVYNSEEGIAHEMHISRLILGNATKPIKKQEKVDLMTNLVTSENYENITLVFEKFPGNLHFYVNSIENYRLNSKNLISITVTTDNKVFTSNKFPVKSFIKPDLYVIIPIFKKLDDMILNISLKEHTSQDNFFKGNELMKTVVNIKNKNLVEIQNKLIENKFILKKDESILSSLLNFCFRKNPNENIICRCFYSYISDNDVEIFKMEPKSLSTLGKWISFRTVAFELMFEGFINIKAELYNYSWKKKYIKWYGFIIYVMDYNTKRIEMKMDLSIEQPTLELIQKKNIRFTIQNNLVEFECLNLESFKKCAMALYVLFPNIRSFI